jgi:hypothetical protein
MIADEVDAEAGPKVGPVQKAVPVAVGVTAAVISGIQQDIHEAAAKVLNAAREADYESRHLRNQENVNAYGLVADECSGIYKRLAVLEKMVESALKREEQIRKNIEER